MPSSRVAEGANGPEGGALGFSRRACLSEWMDEPCTYEEFRDCLRDLAAVNRVTLAYRPTLNWLRRLAARQGPSAGPLHIVDVGCGQGDMLRQVARWAARSGVAVRLTGIDLNPYAARAAAEQTSGALPIAWLTGDAFSYSPPGGIDVVVSSLFTHHLPDAVLVQFLAWMERHARRGWFINDLHRGATPFYLFRLLAGAARWHPFVRHDGPVSIRRSFSVDDWQQYLALAGLAAVPVRIERFCPARLCVGRLK